MTVARLRHGEAPFFNMAREAAQDSRLSWEATGVHTFLLSKPTDWKINVRALASERPESARKDRMQRILGELRKFGYLTVEQERQADGTFDWIATVWPLPQASPQVAPCPDEPDMGEPDTANPPLHRTEGTENRETEKNLSESSDSLDSEPEKPKAPKKKTGPKPLTDEQGRLVSDLTGFYIDQYPEKPVGTLVRQIGYQVRALVRDAVDRAYIEAGLKTLVRENRPATWLPRLVNDAKNGNTGKASIVTGGGTKRVATDWSDRKPGEWARFRAAGGDSTDPYVRQHFDFWRAVGRMPTQAERRDADAWDRALAAARHAEHGGNHETGEVANVIAASFGGV